MGGGVEGEEVGGGVERERGCDTLETDDKDGGPDEEAAEVRE